MEELLKSAARAHLIFIGICLSLIIFSISVKPNAEYADALTFLNYGEEAFVNTLPKTIASIIDDSQDLAAIIGTIQSIAQEHGITISNAQTLTPSNVFVYEISGAEYSGRFASKSNLAIKHLQTFFSNPQSLVVAIPDIEQLQKVLHSAFAGSVKGNGDPVILSGFRFDLIDDERLSTNNNPRLYVNGELGGLTGARALINSAVNGAVKTLAADIRPNRIPTPDGSKRADLVGYMTEVPTKRDVWDAIASQTLPEAKALLLSKIEASKGKVEVLGISMNGGIVLIGGPISLLAVSTYLLMLIGDIKRGGSSNEPIPRYPWFVLFPDKLSKAVSGITLLVIPIAVGFSLIWVFRSEWLLSLFVSVSVICAVLACNMLTLRHATTIRWTRNTESQMSIYTRDI